MGPLGYVFDSAEHISPYLEHPHTGPTSKFCKELAERLGCYVAAGYPERLDPHEANTHAEDVSSNLLSGEMEIEPNGVKSRGTSPTPDRQVQMQVGANSAVLYSPSGECVLGYRKTNLFQTDMSWAKPGVCSLPFRVKVRSHPHRDWFRHRLPTLPNI